MTKYVDPTLEKMMSLYHTYSPNSDQCSSTLVQTINAPLSIVWSILRRFDQPQAYKTLIKSCTMLAGAGGPGSVREVEVVSGLPAKTSREQLDLLDDDMHVMTYRIISGDHRLKNYHSTTTAHEAEKGGGRTVVVMSYLVDVPPGNSDEETRLFVNTILPSRVLGFCCREVVY